MMVHRSLILLLGLVGCSGGQGSDGNGPQDAATPEDAVTPEDAASTPQDAASVPEDGGSGGDASLALMDSGTPDAGRSQIDVRLLPGTKIEDFVALQENDLLRWEAGPQGGFHVFGAARVALEVLDPLSEGTREDVLHTHTLTGDDGAVVARTVRAGRWVRESAGYETRSIRLVLEAGLSPYQVSERPLLYTVQLELPSGGVLESSVVVRTACCD